MSGERRRCARCWSARPDIDAVFAASDLMAVGALRALRAAGRRIPEDVAVVGYDDTSARTADPPLTSVRQPVEEMGREMVRLVIQAIAHGDSVPRHVLLGTELVVRGIQREGRRDVTD